MPNISITAPGQETENHQFGPDQEAITIGRGSDNDITINCGSVSSKHCTIRKTDTGYTLYDDDSTNGVKLDGEKVSECALENGSEISVGDAKLVFKAKALAKNVAKSIAQGTSEEPAKTTADDAPTAQKKWLIPVMLLGLLGLAGVGIMPFLGEVGMASEKATTTIGKWIGFLGEFHPLFLHLPIGALMLVLVMEICRIFTFGRYQPRTTMALGFAAGMGIFAVAFGYCLYLTGEFQGELIESHKRDGIIFTLILIATFMIKYLADVRSSKSVLKFFYGLGLLASVGSMISAGHHGGEITHGDPLDKAPWIKIDDGLSAEDIADPVVYTQIVHPILEQKCISCHGDKKQKSGLRMDTYAFLLEGGDEEECLVPGNVEESMMIAYLHLPLEDDLRMPPEGKTQLTEEEKEILEWWVEIGAPQDARLSEVEVTPAISKALDTLKTPEELAREKAAKEKAEKQRAAAMEKQRAQLQSALTSVNEKFPGSLKYVSKENTDLVFSAVSYRSQFSDADLDVLKGASPTLVEVNLGATKITDEGVKKLTAYPALEVVKLSETTLTDSSLKELAQLKNLRVLNLYGTSATDEGIKALHDHPSLKKIYLWQTKVTPDGAKALEQSLQQKQSGEEEDTEKAEVILGS